MLHKIAPSLALGFALSATAAYGKVLDGYFEPRPDAAEICEKSRRAMDEFLKYHPDVTPPKVLEPLGIDPETKKAYVIVECPYEAPAKLKKIPRAGMFFGV